MRVFEEVLHQHRDSEHTHTEEPEYDEKDGSLAKLDVLLVEEPDEEGHEEGREEHPDSALDHEGNCVDPRLAAHDLESFFHLCFAVLNHLISNVV